MTDGLVVRDLCAGYQGRPVVCGVSLPPLASGRVVALVGPNGAGKSTVLRALAGLLPATGSVKLDGQELVGMPLRRLSHLVGFMPQAFPESAALTVFESVVGALRAMPLGDPPRDRQDVLMRAATTLDGLGIAGLSTTLLNRLSGGQRQLAGLAQAIVRGPRLLLLDEPTSALDLRHQMEVMKLVRTLASEGRVIVMVLHDIALAARWADDIVLLKQGRPYAAGTPNDVLTPAAFAEVYGVDATVTHDADGEVRVVVRDTLDRSSAQFTDGQPREAP